MKALLIAAGWLNICDSLVEEIADAELIIAIDGGLSWAFKLGLVPHLILGDLDSVSHKDLEKAKALNVPILPFLKYKDYSDTELAFKKAEELGATHVTLLAALGGERIDHTLANVLLLLQFESFPWQILDAKVRIMLLRPDQELIIQGKKGDCLSLLPLQTRAYGLRSTGLFYTLDNLTLEVGMARGISNVFTQEKVSLSVEGGKVLVVHTFS